jgi:hypothetical protein
MSNGYKVQGRTAHAVFLAEERQHHLPPPLHLLGKTEGRQFTEDLAEPPEFFFIFFDLQFVRESFRSTRSPSR